ncbi:hypothetical protein COU19_00725 [Candidatus Kaiserbacteria bacterium CG10_big_fil_rev_8_21_14_0_10_56_12]|uniref:Ada DNA repair metal-binding domain-containing protein n=1 Tax=Candidatus Kaiserbacteria bacterium CG10_big_fil_rev_8_21_14_0_10_56_12 TaxID=1974611 RepID=A0A2H0UCH5_9BACT|nr:MAG: hypothetical protein COU19_00725 [Candidatus Kaiserbacteria bacterium CG10_big_fil_rev_8_21_14_0_10_56_12]
MNIADAREKCKSSLTRIPRDVLVVSVLVLASTASFFLGYLAGRDARQGSEPAPTGSVTPLGTPAEVVTSSSGSRYYPLNCPAAQRIVEQNRRYYASPELARAQGYEPADNCTGQ